MPEKLMMESRWVGELRRSRRGVLACCWLVLMLAASQLQARDVFVVISGGGDPPGNNYSQYLQARAYVSYLRSRYSPQNVWVFFGAGNISGRPPVLRDVMQTVKDDKVGEHVTWIAGELPGNRPATREAVERAFREEILPAVRDGGTLYLLVGDHGAPAGMPGHLDSQSLITLWGLRPDPAHRHGWRNYDESLGMGELRSWLAEGLGRGRVVFVMSQCYSGGFHQLGISRNVVPRAEWFARAPAWVARLKETEPLPAAGYTATDELSVASGCTPDVEADRWAGYERYLAENLTGLNLYNLAPSGTIRDSFHDAHVAAALVDQTIDKPRATSEVYLQTWARLFARMAAEPEDSIAVTLRPALERFRKAMDGAPLQSRDRALLDRQAQFRRFNASMLKSNPALKDLLTASRMELEAAIAAPPANEEMTMPAVEGEPGEDVGEPASRGGGPEPQAESGEASDDHGPRGIVSDDIVYRLWADEVESAWAKAIETGKGTALSAAVLNYESLLLELDEPPPPSAAQFFGMYEEHGVGSLDLFFAAGFGDPRTFDELRAREVLVWGRNRSRRILDWAKSSEDARVRVSASVIELSWPTHRLNPDSRREPAEQARPDRRTGAVRVHFFRQVLAAWQFLLEVGDEAALARLQALTDLERTPLPAPTLAAEKPKT